MEEKDRLNSEKTELLRRCLEAEDRLQSAQVKIDKITSYEESIRNAESEKNILEDRVKKLHESLTQKNQQIDGLFKQWEASDVNRIIQEYEEKNNNLTVLQKNIQTLETELQNLFNQFVPKCEQLADSASVISRVRADLPSLRSEIDNSVAGQREISAHVERMTQIYMAETTRISKQFADMLADQTSDVHNTIRNQNLALREHLEKLDTNARHSTSALHDLSQKMLLMDEDFQKMQAALQTLKEANTRPVESVKAVPPAVKVVPVAKTPPPPPAPPPAPTPPPTPPPPAPAEPPPAQKKTGTENQKFFFPTDPDPKKP